MTAAERKEHQLKVPDGFEKVAEGHVFIGKGEVVVTGIPPAEPEDAHNCDEMGCGWDHVLYRVRVRE